MNVNGLPPGARPIADFDDPRAVIPGHAVRDDGVVFYWRDQWQKWIALKPKTGPGGFRKVRLVIRGKVREIGVAHLVCRAFIGPRPIGCEPLHFPDPDPSNNHVSNLRWSARGSSKVGRLCSGRPPVTRRGEDRPNAVLAAADIPEIRKMYRDGFTYREIAIEFGASEETIRKVLTGQAWSHILDPLGPITMRPSRGPGEGANTRLDWETVATIRAGHAAGQSYRQLAAEHDCNWATIRDIIKGRTWKLKA